MENYITHIKLFYAYTLFNYFTHNNLKIKLFILLFYRITTMLYVKNYKNNKLIMFM